MNNLNTRIQRDYSYYLRVERRLSANTVSAYCSDVEFFTDCVRKAPAEIVPEDVSSFLVERANAVSKRSQARILSSLRSFFDWCVVEGERKDNPCDAVDAPKLGKYLPEVLSVGEVETKIE